MTLPAFDTYAYVKKLQEGGFSEEQAAAQVEFQSDVLSSLSQDNLATKQDISEIKYELKLIKWMIGFVLTGIATIVVKLLFFHI